MNPKQYQLKTLEDVIKAVTPENVDNFLIDFSAWLKLHIATKELRIALASIGRIETKSEMTWIDDGKNEKHITIKIEDEKLCKGCNQPLVDGQSIIQTEDRHAACS